MNSKLSMGLWGLGAFLSVGVALVSYRLVTGLPFASPEILGNLFAKPFLAIHVAGAATALLVGMFQFLPAVRRRRSVHRWLGRTYAVGCIVGGLAGLRLAMGTTAGMFAGVGFGLLAVCWIYATVQAWRLAPERRSDGQRAWMIRSFPLT